MLIPMKKITSFHTCNFVAARFGETHILYSLVVSAALRTIL